MSRRRKKMDLNFVEQAARLNAEYEAVRRAHREAVPIRGFELDERAIYVAPPELRVRIGGAS